MMILERIRHGLTYDEFVRREMVEKLERIENNGIEADSDQYIDLNYRRYKRVTKQFTPPEDLKNIIRSIREPQWWLVLTEAWCGDSAQSLPVIAQLAELNDNIKLRILLRDQNPDIMDRYLTNGSRSIPILIAFDTAGRELFTWGPRPAKAAQLFADEKAKGTPKPDIYIELHKWYAKDKGMEIAREIAELILKTTTQNIEK